MRVAASLSPSLHCACLRPPSLISRAQFFKSFLSVSICFREKWCYIVGGSKVSPAKVSPLGSGEQPVVATASQANSTGHGVLWQ